MDLSESYRNSTAESTSLLLKLIEDIDDGTKSTKYLGGLLQNDIEMDELLRKSLQLPFAKDNPHTHFIFLSVSLSKTVEHVRSFHESVAALKQNRNQKIAGLAMVMERLHNADKSLRKSIDEAKKLIDSHKLASQRFSSFSFPFLNKLQHRAP